MMKKFEISESEFTELQQSDTETIVKVRNRIANKNGVIASSIKKVGQLEYEGTPVEDSKESDIVQEYNLAVTGGHEQAAKDKITAWIADNKELAISDKDDKAGYTKVSKAIAFARTTRSAIENKRKELKSIPLEIGKKIDNTARELTALIEPIEEDLKAKKKVIDDLVEEERRKKELEIQQKIDNRTKQLTDKLFTFNGSGYQLAEVVITTGQVKSVDDETWDMLLSGTIEEAYKAEKALRAENKRKQEEEQAKEKLEQRTNNRITTLKQLGFVEDGENWTREAVSVAAKAIASKLSFSRDGIANTFTDEDFKIVTDAAKDDITQAQKELKEIQDKQRKEREELERQQKQLEADKKKLADEKIQSRTGQLNSLKLYFNGQSSFEKTYGDLKVEAPKEVLEYDDAKWNHYFAALTEESQTFENNKASLIEDKRKKDEAVAIQKALDDEKKKQEAEKAEAERIARLAPDKEKLLKWADEIQNMAPPEVANEEAKRILTGQGGIVAALGRIAGLVREEAAKL